MTDGTKQMVDIGETKCFWGGGTGINQGASFKQNK